MDVGERDWGMIKQYVDLLTGCKIKLSCARERLTIDVHCFYNKKNRASITGYSAWSEWRFKHATKLRYTPIEDISSSKKHYTTAAGFVKGLFLRLNGNGRADHAHPAGIRKCADFGRGEFDDVVARREALLNAVFGDDERFVAAV